MKLKLAPEAASARYQEASEHCRKLVTDPAGCDLKLWLEVQDEMAMCKCQLAKAGRLDLIGGAA